MTTTYSIQAYDELWMEVANPASYDPADPLDLVFNFPKQLGCGYERKIQLREGLWLFIFDAQLGDRMIWLHPERPECLRYHFHVFGQHEDKYTTVSNREFALYGSGLAPKEAMDSPAQRALEVTIEIELDTLRSFVGDETEQLPPALQHLVKPVEQEIYTRVLP